MFKFTPAHSGNSTTAYDRMMAMGTTPQKRTWNSPRTKMDALITQFGAHTMHVNIAIMSPRSMGACWPWHSFTCIDNRAARLRLAIRLEIMLFHHLSAGKAL